MTENWQVEREELRRRAAEAVQQRNLRAALRILSRLRDRSLRNRTRTGCARSWTSSYGLAPGARAGELRAPATRLCGRAQPRAPWGEARTGLRRARSEDRQCGAAAQSLRAELADIRRLAASARQPRSRDRHRAARRDPRRRDLCSHRRQFGSSHRAVPGGAPCQVGRLDPLRRRRCHGARDRPAVRPRGESGWIDRRAWRSGRPLRCSSSPSASGPSPVRLHPLLGRGRRHRRRLRALFATTALYELVPPPVALVAAAAVAAAGVVASLAFARSSWRGSA